MSFASIRIVTTDVDRMISFYETVTGTPAVRHTPDFAEVRTDIGTVAIAAPATVAALGDSAFTPGSNRNVIVEFRVDDTAAVDTLFAEVEQIATEVVLPPTTMPWGNRSALVRDPEGTLVNLFALPE